MSLNSVNRFVVVTECNVFSVRYELNIYIYI
jgi:hypothetical protein